jgi:hypothetical protein
MAQLTSKALYGKIDGQRFGSFEDLERAIVQVYNEHLNEFPPGYSYRQLLEWGNQNQWIVRDDGGFKVSIK